MKRPGPIVILTGAGISAESGLKTFRDANGLWEEHRIEDVATPEAYARNPALVQRFYNLRRQQLTGGDVHPNAAHEALARLQRDWPHDVLLVTQNIDDLHERGGSRQVLHMHGELLKVRCTSSGRTLEQTGDLSVDPCCPCCTPPSTMRPHIVWFGEMPFDLDVIAGALASCSMFIAIGTSGQVYPAAGFVQEARHHGAQCVEINLEPSAVAGQFAETRLGPASVAVPAFVDELLAGI